jgi:hypothetical protein
MMPPPPPPPLPLPLLLLLLPPPPPPFICLWPGAAASPRRLYF